MKNENNNSSQNLELQLETQLKDKYDELAHYEREMAFEIDPRRVFKYKKETEILKNQIKNIQEGLESLAAGVKVEEIASRIQNIVGKIEQPEQISALESDLKELKQLIEESQKSKLTNLPQGFEPKYSILRPSVKLVDANLAYKYADLQGDVNILFSCTTLFIGIGISSTISISIAKSNKSNNNIITIHSVVLIMSVIIVIIFGYLTSRAYKKSNETKIKLEQDSEVNEINLKLEEK